MFYLREGVTTSKQGFNMLLNFEDHNNSYLPLQFSPQYMLY